MKFETSERRRIDPVDGRNTLGQANASLLGLDLAFVAERHRGDDAHGGDLVGQDGKSAVGYAYEGDEDDGRDGGHEQGHGCDAGRV
jgi:hypothetical protein